MDPDTGFFNDSFSLTDAGEIDQVTVGGCCHEG